MKDRILVVGMVLFGGLSLFAQTIEIGKAKVDSLAQEKSFLNFQDWQRLIQAQTIGRKHIFLDS